MSTPIRRGGALRPALAGLPGLLGLLGLLAGACIQAPVQVQTVTTPDADLSAIESFALVPPPWPHPEVGEHIESEIREVLTDRDLRQVVLEQADIAISYRARAEQKERVRSISNPDTISYRVREAYVEKTVEIDVFDAKDRQVLWKGIGTIDVVSAPSLPAATQKAVRAILAEFPAAL